MSTALLLARFLLISVFAVAGVAKLADRAGSRRAVIDFGVPTPLAAPLAILLPLAELAVATTLIPASTAFWGALGALALLLLFVGGIGFNLVRGHKPDCRCFGQIHSAPAGWNTLARNGALAAIAGFVVWQGYDGGAGPSGLGWLGELSAVQLAGLVSGVVVLGLLAAQWWFLLNMMRQNGRLLVRVKAVEEALASGGLALSSPNGSAAGAEEGLPLGSPAPEFELPDLSGGTLSLGSLRSSGKPILLLFTDPECGPCNALLPEVGRWQQERAETLTVSLVSRGDPEENRRQADEHGLTNVVLQADWEVSKAYRVRGTPSAVLVLPDDSVGSPVAGGSEAIKSLVGRAVQGQLAR
jgi:methylamine dehydrogenase accessory protein MauD